MGFNTQLRLFLWKNCILQRRYYITTILEILIPTLFSVLLIKLEINSIQTLTAKHYHPEPTLYPKYSLENDWGSSSYDWRLLYTPDTPHVKKIMESTNAKLNSYGNFSLEPVASEDAMEKLTNIANINKDITLVGGVSFVNFKVNGPLPKSIHYRIRLRYTSVIPTKYGGRHWRTDQLVLPFQSKGPPAQSGSYTYSTFLTIQHSIATNFIKMVSGSNLSEPEFSSINFYQQQFPYPPFESSSALEGIMRILVPLFITLSYVFTAPSLIKRIIIEKEEGIKELMKMMGLPGWVQWMGWSCI